MEATNNTKITIGCLSPLTVIIFLAFFFAKIFNYVDWSWWLIFSPLWIPFTIVITLVLIFGLIWIIIILIDLLWK